MAKKKRTILCVDDEEDILRALTDTLMDYYNVKTAANGKEALEVFFNEDISLVITDQRMPEMTGSELLAKINTIKPTCKKILLTGYSDIKAAIDAVNYGALDKYLSKPWDNDELLEIINNLVEDIATDEFIARMIGGFKDIRDIHAETDEAGETVDQYGRFLETFMSGVCLVDKDGRIEHMNSKGMYFLKCADPDDLKGRPFTDIFPMDSGAREKFLAKYTNRDWTPEPLDARQCDGTITALLVNVSFADDKSGRVVTILFDE